MSEDNSRTAEKLMAGGLTATDIWDSFVSAETNDSDNSAKRGLIDEQIDGFSPVEQGKLEAAGAAWYPNVNFRELRNVIRTNATSLWASWFRINTFASLRYVGKQVMSETEIAVHRSVIENELTRSVMQRNSMFSMLLMPFFHDVETFGLGVLWWPYENSWIPEYVRREDVRFPGNPVCNVEGIEIFQCVSTMPITKAWSIIDNRASARIGWKKNAVKEALIRHYKNQDKRLATWNVIASWRAESKLPRSVYDGMDIINTFAVERRANGESGVTHYIISSDESQKDYLFVHELSYGSMSEAIFIMLDDVRKWELSEVRGTGWESYSLGNLSNVVKNAAMANFLIRAGLVAKGPASPTRPMVIRRRPGVTMIPDNVAIVNNQELGSALSDMAYVLSMIDDVGMSANTWKRAPFRSISKTPTQSGEYYQLAGNFMTGADANRSMWFRFQWSLCVRNVVRRIMNPSYPSHEIGYVEAHSFREMCIENGVPEWLLNYENWEASASPSLFSSVQEHLQALGALDRRRNRLGEFGASVLDKDIASLLIGPDGAERYTSGRNMLEIKTNDDSIIALENGLFDSAGKAEAAAEQDQMRHIAGHMRHVLGRLEQIKKVQDQSQGQDPRQVYDALVKCMPAMSHVEEHMKFLRERVSPEDFRQVVKMVTDTANVVKKAIKQAAASIQRIATEEQRKAQQADKSKQSMLESSSIKREGMLISEETKRMKSERQLAQKERAAQQKLEITKRQADQELAIRARKGLNA